MLFRSAFRNSRGFSSNSSDEIHSLASSSSLTNGACSIQTSQVESASRAVLPGRGDRSMESRDAFLLEDMDEEEIINTRRDEVHTSNNENEKQAVNVCECYDARLLDDTSNKNDDDDDTKKRCINKILIA